MANPRQQPPAKPQTTALAPIDSIRAYLAKSQNELAKALPEHVKPETFIRIGLTEMQKNPGLLECSPRSLIGALFQAAQLGLTVDSTLGHAYLVPYKRSCTLIPGYKGLIQLASRSGLVSNIYAQVVRKGDEFDFGEGTKPFIHHKRKLLASVPEDELHGLIAVYAVALMKGGGEQFIVMSRAEIERRASRSPAFVKRSGPWLTDPIAMFKKTPTRDLCKWLPASTEQMQTAVALDERAELGLDQKLDTLAPVGIVDDPDATGLDRLRAALPPPADDEEEEDDADMGDPEPGEEVE